MKKIRITTLLLLVAFLGFGQKKIEKTPAKSIGKVVLLGKKEYTYYALSKKSRTEYTISGPGKLIVNFRVRIEDEDQLKSMPFSVKLVRSGKEVKVLKIPELLMGNLKFKSKKLEGSPTRSYKTEVKVPPGKHTYNFYKGSTKQKVHMKLFFEAQGNRIWKDITPTKTLNTKQLKYVKTGTVKAYYEITKKQPFNFSTKKNTPIRIVVRPVFSYNMLNDAILKIKLQNITTGEITVYKINSKKSSSLEFVKDKKSMPGSSSEIFTDLPEPKNKENLYKISLVSGSKSAIIRVSNE